jgi:hypothetical protein
MGFSKTWLLLVDYKFHAIGCPFYVWTSDDDDICELKEKFREDSPEDLSRTYAELDELTVWKLKGEKTIDNSTCGYLAEILRGIDVNDKDTIEVLDEEVQVADLGLSDGQTLLLRLPDTSPIFTGVGDYEYHQSETEGQGTSSKSFIRRPVLTYVQIGIPAEKSASLSLRTNIRNVSKHASWQK